MVLYSCFSSSCPFKPTNHASFRLFPTSTSTTFLFPFPFQPQPRLSSRASAQRSASLLTSDFELTFTQDGRHARDVITKEAFNFFSVLRSRRRTDENEVENLCQCQKVHEPVGACLAWLTHQPGLKPTMLHPLSSCNAIPMQGRNV